MKTVSRITTPVVVFITVFGNFMVLQQNFQQGDLVLTERRE
jgi:hypothetical protein